jgi:biotin synthase
MSAFRSTFHASIRLQRAYVRSFSSVVDTPITPVSGGPPPPPQARARPGNVVQEALAARDVRHNWTREEISEIYNTSLFDLQYAAVSTTFLS